jgi:hypothetical protein
MSGNGAPPGNAEKNLGEIVSEVSEKASLLVRQEIDLAKAELAEKGRVAGQGAGMLGGAASIGLLAGGALTAAAIAALNEAVALWLAAVIVAVVLAAGAAFLALRGRDRMRAAAPPVPQQTVETVKEDVEWAKSQTPSGRT